jgi:hypothetical protein
MVCAIDVPLYSFALLGRAARPITRVGSATPQRPTTYRLLTKCFAYYQKAVYHFLATTARLPPQPLAKSAPTPPRKTHGTQNKNPQFNNNCGLRIFTCAL